MFLLIRNIYIKRPSKKLDFKKIGLFKITKKILTLNYKLDLPNIIRLRTKVFHISLLKLIPRNAKLDTYVEAEDFEKAFDVKVILDLRVSQGRLKYLIK